MTISRRLTIGFCLVLAMFGLAVAAFSMVLNHLDLADERNAVGYQIMVDIERAVGATIDRAHNSKAYLITFAAEQEQQYKEAAIEFDASIMRAKSKAKNPADEAELLKLIAAVDSAGRKWGADVGDRIMTLAKAPGTAQQAIDLLFDAKSTLQPFREAAANADARLMPLIERNQNSQKLALSFARMTLITSSMLALAMAVVAGLWLSRTIARPVRLMTVAMNELAGGHLEVEIPCANRADELGAMASALMTFRDQGGEKIALEKDASAARGREDESRAEREAMAHDQQAKAEQAVAVLGYGLKRLAEGDLAYRIQTVLYPAAEPLRFDYNTSAEKLRVVMSSIADAIISIRANSHEVSDASEAFSQRLEQQAASLEQTAAAIDHITQTVKHTAEASAVVNATAAQATAEARQGNLKVEATVNAIHDIARSSEKISTIIGVIDEIAFQTNLLALNAGVEAARAGDSGRGFAVVASEVRALAQRSADAAKEIKGLIASAQGNVENGVKRAGEAGGTIARLLAQITEVQTLTTDIAASAKEQAAGAHEVNIAVNTMDQTTQQNAAMVEETTAASRAMADEAAALAELVGSFKLGGENGSALVRAA